MKKISLIALSIALLLLTEAGQAGKLKLDRIHVDFAVTGHDAPDGFENMTNPLGIELLLLQNGHHAHGYVGGADCGADETLFISGRLCCELFSKILTHGATLAKELKLR